MANSLPPPSPSFPHFHYPQPWLPPAARQTLPESAPPRTAAQHRTQGSTTLRHAALRRSQSTGSLGALDRRWIATSTSERNRIFGGTLRRSDESSSRSRCVRDRSGEDPASPSPTRSGAEATLFSSLAPSPSHSEVESLPSLTHHSPATPSSLSAPSTPDQASMLAQAYSLIGQADLLIEDMEFLAELRRTAGQDWEDVYYGRDGGVERLTEELTMGDLDEEDRAVVERWRGESREEGEEQRRREGRRRI